MPVDSTSRGSDYVMSGFLVNFGDLTGLSCTKCLGLCAGLKGPCILPAIMGILLLLLVTHKCLKDCLQLYGTWVTLARDARSCQLVVKDLYRTGSFEAMDVS